MRRKKPQKKLMNSFSFHIKFQFLISDNMQAWECSCCGRISCFFAGIFPVQKYRETHIFRVFQANSGFFVSGYSHVWICKVHRYFLCTVYIITIKCGHPSGSWAVTTQLQLIMLKVIFWPKIRFLQILFEWLLEWWSSLKMQINK